MIYWIMDFRFTIFSGTQYQWLPVTSRGIKFKGLWKTNWPRAFGFPFPAFVKTLYASSDTNEIYRYTYKLMTNKANQLTNYLTKQLTS